MEYLQAQIKDPEKNHFIERLVQHESLLKSDKDVWEHFEAKNAIVDLGCGNGHFLQAYLQKHPEFVGLGIDLRFKRLFKTAEKLKNTDSRVFRGDVTDFLRKSPSFFWEEIWMMFPDPWPKKRHAKHRMIDFKFFFNVYRALKPNGRFCFISDHAAYWDFFLYVNSRSRLFPVTRSMNGDLFEALPTSLFKNTFLKKNTPLYSVEFRKVSKAN